MNRTTLIAQQQQQEGEEKRRRSVKARVTNSELTLNRTIVYREYLESVGLSIDPFKYQILKAYGHTRWVPIVVSKT